ncbi:MAG: hypothetical protein OWQ57_10755 [Sulfobacillus sp.]|nr:hypothetical protein [Sulfobacillus sp.]
MYTCVICSSMWPTPDAAEACAQGPHRICPTCERWAPADSRYCEYDGTALDGDEAVGTAGASTQCWPLTLPNGWTGWACGSQPPNAEDMAAVMDYLATLGDPDAKRKT